MPFEEPDGMTDIDLHEIISSQSATDTKDITKTRNHCIVKLLFAIGTGFIITTCMFLTFLLINDSILSEYPQTITNLHESSTMNKSLIKNNATMNNSQSVRQDNVIKFARKQYKIKRDVSSLYNKLISTSNKNAIQNDLLKSSKNSYSGNSKHIYMDENQLNGIQTTETNKKLEHISSTTSFLKPFEASDNENQSGTTEELDSDTEEYYQPDLLLSGVNLQETPENFTLTTDKWKSKNELGHREQENDILGEFKYNESLSSTTATDKSDNQAYIERALDSTLKETDQDQEYSPTSIYDSQSRDSLTFSNRKAQYGFSKEDPNNHHLKESVFINKRNEDLLHTITAQNYISEKNTEQEAPTSNNFHKSIDNFTTNSWENSELGEKESNNGNLKTFEGEELLTSPTTLLFNSSENENPLNPVLIKDSISMGNEDQERIFTSTFTYFQELTRSISSTVEGLKNENWSSEGELGSSTTKENDVSLAPTIVSYQTTSLFTNNENKNKLQTLRQDSNSEKNKNQDHFFTTTLVYSDITENLEDRSEFGQDEQINGLIKDVTLSTVTASYENSFLHNWDEEEDISDTETQNYNSEENEDQEHISTSTSVDFPNFTQAINYTSTTSYETSSLYFNNDKHESTSDITTEDFNSNEDQKDTSTLIPVHFQTSTQAVIDITENLGDRNELSQNEQTNDNLGFMKGVELSTATTSYEASPLYFNNDKNESTSDTTTKDFNSNEDQKHSSTSTSVYFQTFTQAVIDITENLGGRNELSQTEQTNNNSGFIKGIALSTAINSYETSTLYFNNDENERTSDTTTEDFNSDEDQKDTSTSTPVYFQTSTQAVIDITENLVGRNELSQNEQTNGNLRFIKGVALSTATNSYETSSLYFNNDENKNTDTTIEDFNSNEGQKHTSASTPIYFQTSTQAVIDITENLEDIHGLSQNEQTNGHLGFIKGVASSTAAHSYESSSLYFNIDENDSTSDTATEDFNSNEDQKHFSTSTSVNFQTSTQAVTSNGNLEFKKDFILSSISKQSIVKIDNDNLEKIKVSGNKSKSAEKSDNVSLKFDNNVDLQPPITSYEEHNQNDNELDIKKRQNDNFEENKNDVLTFKPAYAYEYTQNSISTAELNQKEHIDSNLQFGEGDALLPTIVSDKINSKDKLDATKIRDDNLEEYTNQNRLESNRPLLPAGASYESTTVISNDKNEYQLEATQVGNNFKENKNEGFIVIPTPTNSQKTVYNVTMAILKTENNLGQEEPSTSYTRLEKDTTLSSVTASVLAKSEDGYAYHEEKTQHEYETETETSTNDYTSTIATEKDNRGVDLKQLSNSNAEARNDNILSTTTTIYYGSSFSGSNNDEGGKFNTEEIQEANSPKTEVLEQPLSSTLSNYQESPHDITITTESWENKNGYEQKQPSTDNRVKSEIDVHISLKTTTSSFANDENKNQSDIIRTQFDEPEEEDHNSVLQSTPIYTQTFTNNFISTINSLENGDQKPLDIRTINSDASYSSTPAFSKTTSNYKKTEIDKNMENNFDSQEQVIKNNVNTQDLLAANNILNLELNNNIKSTTNIYESVPPLFFSEKYLTSKPIILNIVARFNRKAHALKNRTELLQMRERFSKPFSPEEESTSTTLSAPTTVLTTEKLPLNVRWASQDANSFENIKSGAKEFGTVNEQLQSNQQSAVNHNFGKSACPTFISPMGFPVLQQSNAFPYLYNPSQASPYSSVMSFPVPRAQSNSYIPQQYSYVGTNPVPSYNKATMQQGGYVLYNYNGQNVIAPSPGGQYYICTPVPNVLGNSNAEEISQVEIRKSGSDATLQSFATDILENRTRAARNCPIGERSCEDESKCIKTQHFCDGDVHCKDASDEAFCPCKYRIGKIRECDGYFDCPNGEDESKCFGCEANMFSCDDWSRNDRVATCIPIEQRCDGVAQCPTEKDERDCSIITGTLSGKQHFIVSATVGFLYRNFKGRWYPVCRNPELWANEACQSAAGPSTMAPLAHLIPVDTNYNGPYISSSSEEDPEVVNTCEPGAAIFVECPPLVCGMRKKIRNPFRREEVDTSAEQILSQFSRSSESSNDTDSILGEGRVVGGKPSQPEAWPWIVSVYRNGVFHCGGALINELWIVTAGHCVEKYWHYYYEVQAGVLRRYSYAPMVQNRMISQIISHRLYDRTKLKNDLALMRMSKPVHFGRYVRPICLPSEITAGKHFKWGPEPGTICTAVGWGATVEHGSDPDHLREVEVPVLKHCKHREDQEGNEICAGLIEGGKDACQGDSGGPFMCRNPNSPNQWYLAGIVSHGEGCARPNEPGVYTRVSLFIEWIFDNIRAETVPQTKPLHHCPGYVCRKTNRCIANKRRCNKIIDCLLGDDEMECDKKDFNDIFKHAMRHMFFRSDQDSNETTNVPTEAINLLLIQANVSSTDNLETISDVTETSVINQELTTFSNNQSYNKHFVCKRILQTINISKLCNKIADCEDATDEENCTCVAYLRNSHPQAVCDGLTDCLDMSDEINCHVCKQNEYHCRQSNICIRKEKRCNNIPDCPFEEDEWDCLALTDGKTITLDGDLRPYLNHSGLISSNHNGRWRPLCSNWNGSEATMAAHICFYLGFSDYQGFLKVPIYNNLLQVIQTPSAPLANVFSEGNRCTGLFVKCSDVIDVTHLSEHANISKIINNMQGNPWNAEIYVDGKFKCSGTILDVDWIITSTNCFEKDFKLTNKYVAVLLGRSRTYLNVMGPHEQIMQIIESIQVLNSDIILLRLKKKILISRYVRPIRFGVRDYTVSERETCIALGRNFENSTESVMLQAVPNCTFGFRCFKRIQPVHEFCQNKTYTSWSGGIVCQSKHGWYPAAVFYESKGSCGFTTTAPYTSIQYWRANIIRLMKQAVFAVEAPLCKEFRCSLGRCLEEHSICDNIPDCRDAGDEDLNYCSKRRKHCSTSLSCACLNSELKCQNGKCVPKTAFCNTVNDCGDWSDEPESCNCKSYLALTNPQLICDGIRNCQDRTDEDPLLCSCKGYHFVCGDNHCVPQDMVCDGIPDCPNRLDEAHCIALTSTPESTTTEVQVRTAGIWHPGCFPKKLTTLQLERICEKMGFTGGSAIRIHAPNNRTTTWRPVTDPFMGILIHHGSERKVLIAIRSGTNPFVTLKPDFNCYRLFLQCS